MGTLAGSWNDLRSAPADRRFAPMASAPDSFSPALERLLEKFAGVVRRVCWRYHFTGAEVDELLHEALAAIPASYLHRTALSAAIDLLRRRRARRTDEMVPIDDEPEGLAGRSGPDTDLAESELAEQVERAIQSIQPSRRPVVRMHLMGHTREEIAQVLGWSDSKTRNLLYRGLADVRERLLAEGVGWNNPT